MDLEGWYSVTPELIAAQIAERCKLLRFCRPTSELADPLSPFAGRSSVIVDAFCGVGGNAIQFAFTCEKGELSLPPSYPRRPTRPSLPVIALDISPVRLACAKRNAEIYGVADRITFILGDWVSWSKDYVKRKAVGQVAAEDEVEVVFLSPPWGGIDYQTLGSAPDGTAATPQSKKLKAISHPTVPSTPTPALPPPTTDPSTAPPSYLLSALAPLPGDQLFALARALTPHVAYYLPRNVDIEEVARLPESCPRRTADGEVVEGVERVEIEEEWMGWKMKAVTAYYGDLAVGATEAT
jgi:trimethylguanosine synthase